MTIPAQDNRPELINMTWTYPNGDKGVIANAMFLKKDAGKYEADVKKALQSVKFDKERALRQPLPDFGDSGAAFSPAEATPRTL